MLIYWVVSAVPLFVGVLGLVLWLNLSEGAGALTMLTVLILSRVALAAAIKRGRRTSLAAKPAQLEGGRQSIVGRALRTRSSEAVHAHASGTPCLAASIQLDSLDGWRYLRAARATEFVVEQADGARVAVRGEVWVQQPRATRSSEQQVPALVQELKLDPALAQLPAVVEEHLLREGDRVEVRGELGFEGVTQRAGSYRDGGLDRVLRGSPALVKVLTRAASGV